MKISKIFIAVVVLVIAGYFISSNMKTSSIAGKAKSRWFTKLDANGDGKLSAEEIKAMDTNGDGEISAQEASGYEMSEEEFKRLDTNGDGHISQDEMKTYGG